MLNCISDQVPGCGLCSRVPCIPLFATVLQSLLCL